MSLVVGRWRISPKQAFKCVWLLAERSNSTLRRLEKGDKDDDDDVSNVIINRKEDRYTAWVGNTIGWLFVVCLFFLAGRWHRTGGLLCTKLCFCLQFNLKSQVSKQTKLRVCREHENTGESYHKDSSCHQIITVYISSSWHYHRWRATEEKQLRQKTLKEKTKHER